MRLSKEQINGLIRTFLTVIGSLLLGKSLFGVALTTDLWDGVVGALLLIVQFVWTVKSKELTIDVLQSTLLKVVTSGGMFLVVSGKISSEKLEWILGILATIIPAIYSLFNKQSENKGTVEWVVKNTNDFYLKSYNLSTNTFLWGVVSEALVFSENESRALATAIGGGTVGTPKPAAKP